MRIWRNVHGNLLREKTDYKTMYHMIYIVKKINDGYSPFISVIPGSRNIAVV